ncbi:MAG: hypothetical protein H2184_13280 [Candidatus Galacturonibacter soehngenii]|nr:hypothetical protein [Candidatus Galacturonibacter soehngenii]
MIDINSIIDVLKQRRPIFVSEADFQLELAWVIKELYPNVKVKLEYCPSFDMNMHIDILIIDDGKWIPLELKYKTKKCIKYVADEVFNLKNHSAKDVNSYLYLKDIQRIEKIKSNIDCFEKGYTIFITNELSYLKKPQKEDCIYNHFSLEDGIVKSGTLDWSEKAGAGTKKNCEEPIELKARYKISWKDYSKLDDTNSGSFKILINEI